MRRWVGLLLIGVGMAIANLGDRVYLSRPTNVCEAAPFHSWADCPLNRGVIRPDRQDYRTEAKFQDALDRYMKENQ